ncbi:hypothetical protein [Ruania albidiflava]|uniref:hypothetical protein n=1 Tax=Ruania albidiflava TaxID=366586 RepID=UPI0023F42521|nr:hypothetical protein [Ruania albidiflava]
MEFVVPARFCGPPESGNGGWVSGRLVAYADVDGAASVRLSSPPPLDKVLQLERDGDSTVLLDQAVRIAQAGPAEPITDDPGPAPVSYTEALAAGERYPGLTEHPFPTCFSCGTERDPDDALCLRPGPVAEHTFAAAWLPREVTGEIVWSALDCPGGWALGVGGRPMVLGTMTAQISELPAVGAECVVMSWRTGGEGRKHTAGTALYSGRRLLAQARSVWLEVDPEKVRPA